MRLFDIEIVLRNTGHIVDWTLSDSFLIDGLAIVDWRAQRDSCATQSISRGENNQQSAIPNEQ